jgi:hypothetical protein
MAWEGVHSAHETRPGFLIFISTKLFYIIPKGAFQTGADVVRLRRLLSDMMGRKARMRKV